MEKCGKKMTFEECEMAVLRSSMDKIDRKKGEQLISNPLVKKIITIVEEFIKKNKLICYGGTAINNILPKKDQFYNESEFPDYDFFSPTPLKHVKDLCDIYYKNGFVEVEGKSGVHSGTFKVFVNYIPVADITYLNSDIYNVLKKKSIRKNKIYYSSPDFLRMSMYLELSRPDGDISRWEKVLKRLSLLNKNYPLSKSICKNNSFEKLISHGVKSNNKKPIKPDIYKLLLNFFISHKCVLFGMYASNLYYNVYKKKTKIIKKIPDFDILYEDPDELSLLLKKKLKQSGYYNIEIIKHKAIDDVIPEYIDFKLNNKTLVFIFKPIACHSYNVINVKDKKMRIASLETIFSFYLAFLFLKNSKYKTNRLLCTSYYLYKIMRRRKPNLTGIFKRFNYQCIGKQLTIEKMRSEKTEKYNELKNKRGTKDFEWWFLRYIPHIKKEKLKMLSQYNSMKAKGKKRTKKKKCVKKTKSKTRRNRKK
jgi:hypothetical protein